jgi:hypothetical protein
VHYVLGELRARLILGAAEMRTAGTPGPQTAAWAAQGRRRVEAVLAEARRFKLPLLVQQAEHELAQASRVSGDAQRPKP